MLVVVWMKFHENSWEMKNKCYWSWVYISEWQSKKLFFFNVEGDKNVLKVQGSISHALVSLNTYEEPPMHSTVQGGMGT